MLQATNADHALQKKDHLAIKDRFDAISETSFMIVHNQKLESCPSFVMSLKL